MPGDLPPAEGIRAGLDAFLEHISHHARAYVSLMRGGIGSDPEVAQVVESVRTRLADGFLDGSPFQPMLAGNVRFRTVVRGWIGFVESATIDWCDKPKMSRVDLRDLLAEVFLAIMGAIAPQLLK